MKQLYVLIIALTCALFSSAQTEGASILYGYFQKQTPGTIRVDDNGNEKPRQQQYNYFIYLASGITVVPTEIWINGQPHAVTVTEVSSPVQYKHPNRAENKPQTLVPKTSRKVLQLTPSAAVIEHHFAKTMTMASKNQVVVLYRANTRWYYKTLLKLKELEPVMMQ
jgi:hypothetical protein